jgi:hypothetical protein
MNETPVPSHPERPVTVQDPRFGRLWTLTLISLALNGLILLFILVGIIVHHHRVKGPGFADDRGGFRGGPECACGGGPERFHHFHHFGWGGEEMGRRGREGFDRGGPDGGNAGFGPRGGGWGGPQGGFERHEEKGMGMGGMAERDPANMADAILQHLGETLNLTDDQKTKMKPIIQADVEQFQKDAEAERQAMQKRMEDAKARLKPLLTADQQKELDAMPMPGHPSSAPGEMGSNVPPPAPGK